MTNYALLLQAAEKHITLGKIALEYIGFLSFFWVYGALGFHFQVLKSLRRDNAINIAGNAVDRADRRAATIGIAGAVLMVVTLLTSLLERAQEKNISMVSAISAGGGRQIFQIVCIGIFLVCFALAAQRVRVAWLIAAITGFTYALRNITSGRWASNVNPLHEVAASLWLGTLMVLLVAGMSAALRRTVPSEERGRLVAEMVSRFSPLALSAAALLATTGVITAWRHLKHWNAIWTTPYGFAFVAKLCVVAIVVALGAWNWRRKAPQLGNEESAVAITRSATAELSFAAIVLAITALLVSLPSPK